MSPAVRGLEGQGYSVYKGELERSRTLDDVGHVVRRSARWLAGSDGATFVLRDGDLCFYADEDSIAPLWKGQRFPMTECVSGWAMLHEEPAVIPDISRDPRIPLAVYLPTFVRSLVMVPIGHPAVGAIGADRVVEGGGGVKVVERRRPLAHAAAAANGRIGLADAPWAPNFGLRDSVR